MAGLCSGAGNQRDNPCHVHSAPRKPLEQALLLAFRGEVSALGIDVGIVGPTAFDLIKDPIPTFFIAFPKADFSDHHDRRSWDTEDSRPTAARNGTEGTRAGLRALERACSETEHSTRKLCTEGARRPGTSTASPKWEQV